jgi:hypothetical protein
MLVVTDDKNMPEIRLELSGDVSPRAYLSTDTIRLTGTAGTEIMGALSITPTPDNPFKIIAITAEKGTDIRFELTETDNEELDELKKYLLTAYNLKKEKGWYIDKLHIKTDSDISPELVVTVFGVIRDGSP